MFEIHALIAAYTHPAFALEPDEAHALAVALANVQRHYPGVRLLSDKHMALANLAMISGRLYGKRALILIAKPAPAGHAPGANGATPPAQTVASPIPAEVEGWFPGATDTKQ